MLKTIFTEDLAFFVSNMLHECITKTDIIAFFYNDLSLILLALKLDKLSQTGRGLWKFSNSLLFDEDFFCRSQRSHSNDNTKFK